MKKKITFIELIIVIILINIVIQVWNYKTGAKSSGHVNTPTQLSTPVLQSAGPYIFVTKWGSPGFGDGQFDCAGLCYKITDKTIEKLRGKVNRKKLNFLKEKRTFWREVPCDFEHHNFTTEEMELIMKYSTIEKHPKYLEGAVDIAVDKSGYIYIIDNLNCRVQKFDSSGNFITKWGSEGKGEGEFTFDFSSICVDGDNNVYVANGSRIQKFNSYGNFISAWNSYDKDEKHPIASTMTLDLKGNFYVGSNKAILIFDPNKNFIDSWTEPETVFSHFDYYRFSISIVASEYIYVLYVAYRNGEPMGSNIYKFDGTGKFIKNWPTRENFTGTSYIGDIVIAEKEIYGDEGLSSKDGFRTLNEILDVQNEFIMYIPEQLIEQKNKGTFVTVSTCTGTLEKGKEIEKRFNAICENMEGAAIAHICAFSGIPAAEIRGISNIIEDRTAAPLNKADIIKAAENAQRFLLEHIGQACA